ncbi:MAG: hypothetical protein ACHQPI_05000 [Thermoanaerobaculia bacterium]
MIRVTSDGKGIRTYQVLRPPTVYLDHWALMKIACDPDRSSRFRRAVTAAKGTLAFSWMGLYEFSGITNQHQLAVVDQFLAALYPEHLAFVLTDPDEIVANEDRLLGGAPRQAPHLDAKLCQIFVSRALALERPIRFVAAIAEPEAAAKARARWVDACSKFARMIQAARNMPGVMRRLSIKHGETKVQSPLRYVNRAALILILKNERTRLDTHHWSDFIHAIVPACYCDLVLLDRGWATMVRQVFEELSRKEVLTEHAEIFTARTLDGFWQQLEGPSKGHSGERIGARV